MPGLLSGGKALKGTTGTTSIFITLPTAQLSLGQTPTRDTGYTLVTGANGQLFFTATMGAIYFSSGTIQSNVPNRDLVIQSTGTGAVRLEGNVLINGKDITELTGTINDLTVTNLTVTGQALFTSATSTATFAGDLTAQAIYDSGNRVLTSFTVVTSDGLIGGQVVSFNSSTITLKNTGVLEILPGADISLDTPTGVVTVSSTATLQSVTNRGSTTTNAIHITSVTSSTTSTNGALIVGGGVGAGGDVQVAGDVYSNGGSSAYSRLLYSPKVTVSTSTPVASRIGDFWIDPSIGVEFQYVPNGTQTVWIQFIGF